MGHGEFLWCDLATFGVNDILKFYRAAFEWRFNSETFPDGSVYHYASNTRDVTAGIYEMPTIYREQGMASFWMTYIGVDEVGPAIDHATELGGRLLLGPATFGIGAAIAMIEDPLGAVFTVFSGRNLQPRRKTMEDGCHVWDSLLSEDPDASAEFYGGLFNWRIDPPDADGRRLIRNLARSATSQIRKPDVIDGDKPSRWNVGFAVNDLPDFLARVKGAGGNVVANGSTPGKETFVADTNGARFSVRKIGQSKTWLD